MKVYLLLAVLCAGGAIAQERSGEFIKDQLLVKRREGASPADARKAFATHGAREEAEIAQIRVHVLRLPEQAIERVRAALLKSGEFEFVERDGVAASQAMPVDPYLPSQWHLYKIDMPGAWLTTMGSANVPIAILDGGVDQNHPDLAAKVVPGYNFVSLNSDTSDLTGHGTKVAGAAAAAIDNNIGIASVAGLNPIMPVVVMNASSYASYSNIAKGITYAADRGVRIINISITGTTASSTLQSAVNYAWNKKSTVFAAAGNSNSTSPGYPEACDKVIGVGATDGNDLRASYSNYGAWIDVVAPGSGIYTTFRGGTYGNASGTSFASPITAAVGALMLSIRPDLTPDQLTSLLRSSSTDLGSAGFDSTFGAGRVDANRALQAAQQAAAPVEPVPTEPAPAPTKPGKGNR